jgi:hypothetical protein
MNDDTPFESDRNGRERRRSRRSVLRGASALAVTVGFGSVATDTVAADHNGDQEDDGGPISDFAKKAGGGLSKARGVLAGRWQRWRSSTTSASPSTLAADAASVFNTHSSTLVAYANEHVAASREKTGLDTIRVEFTKDGETATRWLVASVADGDFTAAEMVDADPGRTVDHYVELRDLVADNASDELEHFVDEYAEPNRKIDPGYEGRLAGKYGDDVDSSLLN